MPKIRGLTVRQPWAWAITYAGKTVENRPQRIGYRGLLAIHAGLQEDPGFFPSNEQGREAARAFDKLGGRTNLWDARNTYIGGKRHPGQALGAIVAVAELIGCHLDAACLTISHHGRVSFCTPWAARDSWHWELANVRPLGEPVPCRGMQGLWPLPEPVEAAVLAAIPITKEVTDA